MIYRHHAAHLVDVAVTGLYIRTYKRHCLIDYLSISYHISNDGVARETHLIDECLITRVHEVKQLTCGVLTLKEVVLHIVSQHLIITQATLLYGMSAKV